MFYLSFTHHIISQTQTRREARLLPKDYRGHFTGYTHRQFRREMQLPPLKTTTQDMRTKILLTIILSALPLLCSAQKVSLSTNLVDYAMLGTMNVEGSVALGRHVSTEVSARINPWTFHEGDPGRQMQNRHQTYAIGARYWTWHVYSGWWISGMAQYQEYNRGGILSLETEEGDAFGFAAAAGYSLMLHENFNLDFGLGIWTGQKTYITYACPSCGRITDKGSKWFVLPNEIKIALQYIF